MQAGVKACERQRPRPSRTCETTAFQRMPRASDPRSLRIIKRGKGLYDFQCAVKVRSLCKKSSNEAPARTCACCCCRNLTGLNLLAPQHTCEAACLQYPLRAKAEGVAQDVRLAIASHRDVPSSSLCGSTLATATSTAAIICAIATITIIAHISHLHAPSESEPHDGSGSFT